MKNIWNRIKRGPNLWAFIGSIIAGAGTLTAIYLFDRVTAPMSGTSLSAGPALPAAVLEALWTGILGGGLAGIFLIHPLILTLQNLFLLFRKGTAEVRRVERRTESVTIALGIIYTGLYDWIFSGSTSGIQFRSDWQEVLHNGQMHTPIWTQSALTIAVISCVGVLGYLMLSKRDINRLPPLLTVLGISAIYLGIGMCVLWIVQVMGEEWLFCLFPFNCVLIGVKTVRRAVEEWQGPEEGRIREWNKPYLKWLNDVLLDASHWPVAALILMLPLLGILIGILALLGQQPDSVIRAWTETGDWRLSQQIPPPNVMFDEHYLCTVAAQGHPEVVKPLRTGVRNGHRVVVNRQLCVANAFEQILEERAAWLHGPIRRFYDRYGFPVARLIRSSQSADLVYYMMKPLEWLFLAVLYLVDEKPENRIAVQYPHAPVPKWR